MTKSTQAIRMFDQVTMLGDSMGRVRVIRLATRQQPPSLRWWPDNPPGKSETRIGKRHLTSLILSTAAVAPANAAQAVDMLERLPYFNASLTFKTPPPFDLG